MVIKFWGLRYLSCQKYRVRIGYSVPIPDPKIKQPYDLKLIPQELIKMNNLEAKIKNGYIYMEIQKGIYGLSQAGVLSNKLPKELLTKYGY